jgi:hypothetical protein
MMPVKRRRKTAVPERQLAKYEDTSSTWLPAPKRARVFAKMNLRALYSHLFMLQGVGGAHSCSVSGKRRAIRLRALCSAPASSLKVYSNYRATATGFIPFYAFRRKEWP